MRRTKVGGWLAIVALLACLFAALFWLYRLVGKVTTTTLTGTVLVDDHDPEKQVPIPGSVIQASLGKVNFRATADETGYFRLVLPLKLLNQSLNRHHQASSLLSAGRRAGRSVAVMHSETDSDS